MHTETTNNSEEQPGEGMIRIGDKNLQSNLRAGIPKVNHIIVLDRNMECPWFSGQHVGGNPDSLLPPKGLPAWKLYVRRSFGNGIWIFTEELKLHSSPDFGLFRKTFYSPLLRKYVAEALEAITLHFPGYTCLNQGQETP